MQALTAHIFPFSVNKTYMLNPIILYQNVSCATGTDYLACIRKKSEIIGDYLEIFRDFRLYKGDVW